MKNSKLLKTCSLFMIGAMYVAPALARKNYPKIYPFVPMTVNEIYSDVEKVTEDKNFIKNIHTMRKLKLSRAKTKMKPWGASYWPLAKGGIADPYETTKVSYYVEFARTHKGVWKKTAKSFKARERGLYKKIDKLTSGQLSMLSPSEKYDILLGDKSFDLTRRLMSYMSQYGKDNYFGSLTRINVAEEDTVEQLKKYVEWGWASSIREAMDNFVLAPRLEIQMAKDLLARGEYTDPLEAVRASIPMAMSLRNNYVLSDRKSTDIASWEGICNGWSTAAGIIPRPKKAVIFTLPDNRTLKFYPEDIKGLISLYWFNSYIQNSLKKSDSGEYKAGGTTLVGNRCNQKNVRTDSYGRRYDTKKDPYSNKLEPRCVGVHPAKWHLGLVNLIGKQGRSFIVERKVDDPVDNHPMYKYKMKYFNPNSGYYNRKFSKNIEPISSRDQFRSYRHKDARYIVGVQTVMTYIDYHKPFRALTNGPGSDKRVDKKMLYDLELDANYNVVGGQWRTVEAGTPPDGTEDRNTNVRPNYNQPDFFWAVTKDWKKSKLFDNEDDLASWNDTSVAPPRSWLEKAKQYHSFNVVQSTYNGNGVQCNVKDKVTGRRSKVWCELSKNRPQPLSNVVNKLVELSSGVSFDSL